MKTSRHLEGAAARRRFPGGPLVIGAVIAAATVALFLPVRGFDFLKIDDLTYVPNNPAVNRGFSAEGLRQAFAAFRAGNWHPLAWLSHMLDVQLFGLDAGAHHLVNLGWHAANAALLFLVLRAATAALWPSALVAALFALHPLHVESFAWVAERKDLVCAFFSIAAVGGHIAHARRPSTARYAAATLLFALALTAKAMAVTLPAVLLILDWWPLGRLGRRGRATATIPVRRVLLEKVPLALLSLLAAAAALAAQAGGGALDAAARHPLGSRLANAVLACGTYLAQLAWPAGLSVFYPLRPPSPASVAIAAAALAAITAAALRLARRRPAIAAGWAFYLVTLVPVIGIVQVGSQARADRYTYLPAVGVFIAIAWALREIVPARPAPRAAAAGAALLALALLAGAARTYALLWRDTTTLFTHALAVDPGNYMAHFHVGNARFREGDAAAAANHYREALRLRPDYGEAANNLGAALAARGRLEEALAAYRAAVPLSRDPATTRYNISLVLEDLGRAGEARRELELLVRSRPDFAPARNRLRALDAPGRPAHER